MDIPAQRRTYFHPRSTNRLDLTRGHSQCTLLSITFGSVPPQQPLPWFLKLTGHESQVVDLRYRYGRGVKVRVVTGEHQGKVGTIESRVPPQRDNVDEPGYHLTLDNGQWATVPWDGVELARWS